MAADIETASEGYARRFAGPVGAWMLARQSAVLLDWLASTPGSTVLDVGGGHAQTALPLMYAGHRVTVHGSAESCRDRIAGEVASGKMAFVISPLLEIPFPDRAFDHVVCIRLLAHCPRWPELIREICRLARQSVVVDYPNRSSVNLFSGALFGAKKKVEKNTRPFALFAHREIAGAFAAEGFSVQDRANLFFLPMALHRALGMAGLSRTLESFCGGLGLTRRWGSPTLLCATRREGRKP